MNEGVSRLTPLGVLYLLMTSEMKHEVQQLLGKDLDTIQASAKAELKQRYSQGGQFVGTEDTVQLIEIAVEKAGGANRATVGHLILAMLSDNASQADAYQFLTQLGISEKEVKKNMEETPSGNTPMLERLTTDFLQEIANPTEPIIESPLHSSLITRILALLNKRSLANVVLAGFPGVGRHTLLTLIAQKIQSGQLEAFKGFKIRKLNWNALEGQSRPQDSLIELTKNLRKVILLVDNLTAARIPIFLPCLDAKTPILGVTTSAEEKKFGPDIAGKAITIQIDEPAPDVVAQIMQSHLRLLVDYHQLKDRPDLTEQEIDMLSRLGPSISGLSLPGGAIHLLDLVASRDALVGNQILEADDIASLIQEHTGISAGTFTQKLAQRFNRVAAALDQRIIGQKPAKQALVDALNRAQAGLRDPKKPLGVFAFLGPTGVGKTETVKALAEALFDDEDFLVRIDLSEYQEQHTTSRLVGAPPGYVGYDEGGQLTEIVRRRPFCVILFDEADKAHPDVYNILLQLMDDGRLTDGHGRTVDFRNTLVIFTSNHGSSMIIEEIEAGTSFEQISQNTVEWFKDQVPPEFYNRFQDVIVFQPINEEDAWLILDMQLRRIIQEPTKARYGIGVELTASAKAFLHRKGYSPEYGARPLQRAISNYVGTPLASMLLGDLKGATRITCDHDGTSEQLTITRS